MKLVIGLGNPGRRYAATRHNVGYEVVAQLARRHAAGPPRARFQGEVLEATVGSESLLLLRPETFMNLSGTSVLEARQFYKVPLDELLVVCDDLNLPLGKLRVRPGGSSGGQKGLEDIIRRLGSDEVPRLRIGIGQPPPQWQWADYVLSKFGKDEVPEIELAVQRAADAVAVWATGGLSECMNRYNS